LGNFGKHIRLSRILRRDRGTLVVAFDHALVLGPIPGTQDPSGQIRRLVAAEPDAVLLNFGNIRFFSESVTGVHAPGVRAPGFIARLDWTTAFDESAHTIPKGLQACLVAHPDDALRAGADAVITFLFMGSGDREFEKKEVGRVGKLARSCERIGMPLIVESLARGAQIENPREAKWLMLHTRIAAELGADAVKTEAAADLETMRLVVSNCPVPVLVLGGSRVGSDKDVIRTVRGIMQSGAAGVFFGRNVFQSKDMLGLLQRIKSTLAQRPPARGN